MQGTQRREALLQLIGKAEKPISGTALSEQLGVSRQIVVQDIALLRAQGHSILSTNRGYRIVTPVRCSRVFKVCHTDEQMAEELNAIVDLGAVVEDVFVHHKVYGKLDAKLQIASRRDVTLFLEGIHSGKSTPLKNITSGYHYHTVSARSEEVLSLVEDALRQKGFLVESPNP
ncbi:MAG: transcription repressor NadR [Oscillospiraceae bacterium]|nr:transcription repressor NadR [Oscillospiraceae bacterium]